MSCHWTTPQGGPDRRTRAAALQSAPAAARAWPLTTHSPPADNAHHPALPQSLHREHLQGCLRVGPWVATGEEVHVPGSVRLKVAALVLACSAVIALGGPAFPAGASGAAPCANSNLRPTGSNLPTVDAATVCLIDRVRRSTGVRPLRPNRSLHGVATNQSAEMVLGDYFGDNSRSGQTPLQRIAATRYRRHTHGLSTAQNIGWGTGTAATPAAIVAAWMASPPHRRIMLSAGFRDVGVGAAPAAPAALAGGQPGATYTVDFGKRLG
jgi:uncharacterized protein YkwD